jgi:hypothetical protein
MNAINYERIFGDAVTSVKNEGRYRIFANLDARRHANLADLYCAFGKTFLRSWYHQILGPGRHLPKLANGLCSHASVSVHLDPHLSWQPTKSYVQRGNALGLYRIMAPRLETTYDL